MNWLGYAIYFIFLLESALIPIVLPHPLFIKPTAFKNEL
jgi:hypothetical protein